MFGQSLFGAGLFGQACCCDTEPTPPPSQDPGGGGAVPWPREIPRDFREERSEEDDIALALSLLL